MKADETTYLRLLSVAVYELWSATGCIGTPVPRVREIAKWMHKPAPGQLVMETTTVWLPERDEARFGRLLAITSEPYDWDPEDLAPGEEIPERDVWHLVRADGSVFRWENASFVAVPEEISGFMSRLVVGERLPVREQ